MMGCNIATKQVFFPKHTTSDDVNYEVTASSSDDEMEARVDRGPITKKKSTSSLSDLDGESTVAACTRKA